MVARCTIFSCGAPNLVSIGVVWQCSCGAYTALGRHLCGSCGKRFAGPIGNGFVRPPAPMTCSDRCNWCGKSAARCDCYVIRVLSKVDHAADFYSADAGSNPAGRSKIRERSHSGWRKTPLKLLAENTRDAVRAGYAEPERICKGEAIATVLRSERATRLDAGKDLDAAPTAKGRSVGKHAGALSSPPKPDGRQQILGVAP